MIVGSSSQTPPKSFNFSYTFVQDRDMAHRAWCASIHRSSRLIPSRQSGAALRRPFSAKAIYSSFPATLHYYAPRSTSSLFNHREIGQRPDDIYDEGVAVDQYGLVYPSFDKSVSNGAVMFPNTFMMQEYIRGYYDDMLDREEQGKQVDVPYIFTIPKRTPLPSHLVLINEYISRFSLQPSCGMTLAKLNRCLDEFYGQYAHKQTALSWLEAHNFEDAISDDEDHTWMAM